MLICFFALFFSFSLLSGCGLIKSDSELNTESPQKKAAEEKSDLEGTPIPYDVDIVVEGGNSDLLAKMKEASSLVVLAKKPPDSLLGIEQRAKADAEVAVKLLQSECYYDGKASYTLTEHGKPRVCLTLTPGPRYTLARARLTYEPAPRVPESFRHRIRRYGLFGFDSEPLPEPNFPKDLPKVTVGQPITAKAMLAAVEAFPETLQKTGYPFARVRSSHYAINRDLRELYADIVVDPGPPAVFGDVRVRGNKEVEASVI
ncbi:MAG: outer membrane protein assembly factor, partial [Desulfovibrio sp.]|nr:outer membrane protein assembly factor [Desulfovibrio sp.]